MKSFIFSFLLITLIPFFCLGYTTAVPATSFKHPGYKYADNQKPMTNQYQQQLRFEGNSEAMLDAVCGYVPRLIRKPARNAFLKKIEEVCSEDYIVTEECVVEAVLSLTPKSFHEQTIQLLYHHKTADE